MATRKTTHTTAQMPDVFEEREGRIEEHLEPNWDYLAALETEDNPLLPTPEAPVAVGASHKDGTLRNVRYACKGKQFRGAAWHRTHR